MLATMTLEALLAYAHLLAIFALVVFFSSEAAQCREEWLDAAGTRPAANEVARVRRLVMIQAHLMPLIPLAAVFLARGYGH
jgi:putative membrane protein